MPESMVRDYMKRYGIGRDEAEKRVAMTLNKRKSRKKGRKNRKKKSKRK